jgi:hypothetical protein
MATILSNNDGGKTMQNEEKSSINYEAEIIIDETALDVEWLEQAALFLKYARHLAQSRMELDQAKQALDIIRAGLDKDIRELPDQYGITKITDKAVEATIITLVEYQEAFQEYLDAKYETDMSQGAVQAFQQRKDALQELVRLHGQSYFAGPSIPRDLEWEREAFKKKTNAGIAAKLNKSHRRTS